MQCQVEEKGKFELLFYQKSQKIKVFGRREDVFTKLIEAFSERPRYSGWLPEYKEYLLHEMQRGWRDLLEDMTRIIREKEYSSAPSSGFEYEKECFEQMKEDLLKTYEGEYVAIYRGEVVDHGKNQIEVLNRVYKKYGYVEVYCHLVSKKPVTYKIVTPFKMK